jgi:hypothetical protein
MIKLRKDDHTIDDIVIVAAAHVLDEIGGDTATLIVRRLASDGTYIRYPFELRIRETEYRYISNTTVQMSLSCMPIYPTMFQCQAFHLSTWWTTRDLPILRCIRAMSFCPRISSHSPSSGRVSYPSLWSHSVISSRTYGISGLGSLSYNLLTADLKLSESLTQSTSVEVSPQSSIQFFNKQGTPIALEVWDPDTGM